MSNLDPQLRLEMARGRWREKGQWASQFLVNEVTGHVSGYATNRELTGGLELYVVIS